MPLIGNLVCFGVLLADLSRLTLELSSDSEETHLPLSRSMYSSGPQSHWAFDCFVVKLARVLSAWDLVLSLYFLTILGFLFG